MGDADEGDGSPSLDQLRTAVGLAREQDDVEAVAEAQAELLGRYVELGFELLSGPDFDQVVDNSAVIADEAAKLDGCMESFVERGPTDQDESEWAETVEYGRQLTVFARQVAEVQDLLAAHRSHARQGNTLGEAIQFEPAAAEYHLAEAAVRQAYDIIKRAQTEEWEEDFREGWDGLLHRADSQARHSAAHAAFATGLALRAAGRRAEAIEQFSSAEACFRDLSEFLEDEDWLIYAEWSAVSAVSTAGLEQLSRSDPAGAATELQRAKVRLESTIEDDIPARLAVSPDQNFLLEVNRGLRLELGALNSVLEMARARTQQSRGNWAAALTHTESQISFLQETFDAFPAGAKSVGHVLRFEIEVAEANAAVLRAEQFKDQNDWVRATECYEESRKHSDTAADFILKSGFPNATGIQEAIANTTAMNIGLLIRHTETARRQHVEVERLRSELSSMQASLTGAFQNFGINVNTKAEVVATVEQQLQVIQHVETSVRTVLDELADAVATTELDPGTKAELLRGATDLAKSEDHGVAFIERAKRFTGDVASIVQSAAAAAVPLAPIVQKLGQLVGVG